ncbi:DUF1566 domain-containing protein [Photobacterium rosenbergii]|nr:DUF1566 domain-containing protein [Photobacterium rosenbergii]
MNKTEFKNAFFRISKLTAAIAITGMTAFSTVAAANQSPQYSYSIVDTNQSFCTDAQSVLGECPTEEGKTGFGQDAQYQGNAPSYSRNNDGTVTDNNTGLMWAQTTDTNGDGKITAADKMTYDEAFAYASNLELAGHSDWRVPTIKELYSLMMFDGEDPSGLNGAGTYSIRPFIDHEYFGFESGDLSAGERLIDSQYVSSTKYVSTTMNEDETVFGVNFIDGRIKGYGMESPHGGEKTFYVMVVRGNTDYGINDFSDNNNGTVTDKATGLTWQQADSGSGMDWPTALEYCENLELAGNSDWRLPNIKELQSIVDYSKSPDTSNSAAIDSVFEVTPFVNEGGKQDYPNYWSSTTHLNLKNGQHAAYMAFGRSLGYMNGEWIDVHGAGAQRSDPKVYNGVDYPEGHGPQGDAIRYSNSVRCVTDSNTVFEVQPESTERATKQYTLDSSDTSMDAHKPGNQQEKGKTKRSNEGDRQGHDPFTQMDTNNDGKLSRDEARGPLKRDFDRLDTNNDGYLTRDELPKRLGK